MQSAKRENFSYSEYRNIINLFDKRKFFFFSSDLPAEYIILRHDVEFSLTKALHMAEIDYSEGVKSTFFVQVVSGAYNSFSVKNKELITKIINMGHQVGLHLYISNLPQMDHKGLRYELERQKTLFEIGLNASCRCFSFHRPPAWVLAIRDDEMGGMLNAYGESFFEYTDVPQSQIYLSDSRHRWKYGYPSDFLQAERLQILMHPDEWSENIAPNPRDCFSELKETHNREFVDILKSEGQHFAELECR